jgi:hypothetical protein
VKGYQQKKGFGVKNKYGTDKRANTAKHSKPFVKNPRGDQKQN